MRLVKLPNYHPGRPDFYVNPYQVQLVGSLIDGNGKILHTYISLAGAIGDEHLPIALSLEETVAALLDSGPDCKAPQC